MRIAVAISILFLLSLPLISIKANSTEQLIPIEHFSIENDLSDNGVTFAFEDSRGYMWFGTYDGLNRYDGYEISVFKNGVKENLLASNRILCMDEDINGNLWIGTEEGITVYNFQKDIFQTIYANRFETKGASGPYVSGIYSHKDKIYCITKNMDILIFNAELEFQENIRFIINSGAAPVFQDGDLFMDTHIIILSNKETFLFDLSSYEFSTLDIVRNTKSVVSDNQSLLFIGQNTNVITYKFEQSESGYTFQKVNQISTLPTDEPYNWGFTIRELNLDMYGKLWVGTMNKGFFCFDDVDALSSNKKYSITRFGNNSEILRVSKINPNSYGGCWVGTYNNGVYRFTANKSAFGHYTQIGNQPYDLQGTVIIDAVEYAHNKILLTNDNSETNNLGLFNTLTKKFESIPFNIDNKYSSAIGHMNKDNNGNIWFIPANTQDKTVYLLRNGELELEYIDLDSLLPTQLNHLQFILTDHLNNLWLGTTNNVYCIKIDKTGILSSTESLRSKNELDGYELFVRAMKLDGRNKQLWVGTQNDGLIRLDLKYFTTIKNAPYKQYLMDLGDEHSISSNFVTGITFLSENGMWISTERGGICKVENYNGDASFIAISEKNGLSSNKVKSLVHDGQGALWIATNKSLDKYDLTEHSVTSFGLSEGLLINSFETANTILDNGTVVFGGTEGFCFFNPLDVKKRSDIPKITLREFHLQNMKVTPGDTINNRILLSRHIAETGELTLTYKENILAFELVSAHYSNPNNHYIRYKLSPLNTEWLTISSDKRFIYFNGLQPGRYTLEVQASNSINEWSESISLQIIIKPPFWNTWLFRIAILILLACVGYLLFRKRMKTMQEEKVILQKKIDKSLEQVRKIEAEVKTSKIEVEQQKAEIKRRDIVEREIRFHNEGMTLFSKIISSNTSLSVLCQNVLSKLIEYLDVQMGLIYIITDEEEPTLQAQASYASHHENIESIKFHIGEGYVGTTFKLKEICLFSDIPDDYMDIESGLGSAKPKNICFIPIIQDSENVGVIELASFGKIEQYKIDFVSSLGENIASSILLMRSMEHNAQIIKDTQEKAEMLQSQDEELRQQVEEMHATQEELQKRNEEAEEIKATAAMQSSLINSFMSGSEELIFVKDIDGKFTQVSNSMIHFFRERNSAAILGKTECDYLTPVSAVQAKEEDNKILDSGKAIYNTLKNISVNGDIITLNSSKIPYKNIKGEIIGTIGILRRMTVPIDSLESN